MSLEASSAADRANNKTWKLKMKVLKKLNRVKKVIGNAL